MQLTVWGSTISRTSDKRVLFRQEQNDRGRETSHKVSGCVVNFSSKSCWHHPCPSHQVQGTTAKHLLPLFFNILPNPTDSTPRIETIFAKSVIDDLTREVCSQGVQFLYKQLIRQKVKKHLASVVPSLSSIKIILKTISNSSLINSNILSTFKMLFNVLTVATLLSAAATAAPVEVEARQTPAVEGYSWSVTDWYAGCSRSTCVYGFNITGAAHDPNIPSFSARCDSWAGEGAEYTPCGVNDEGPGNRGVFAKLLAVNETGTGAHIQVSYKWTDLEQA